MRCCPKWAWPGPGSSDAQPSHKPAGWAAGARHQAPASGSAGGAGGRSTLATASLPLHASSPGMHLHALAGPAARCCGTWPSILGESGSHPRAAMRRAAPLPCLFTRSVHCSRSLRTALRSWPFQYASRMDWMHPRLACEHPACSLLQPQQRTAASATRRWWCRRRSGLPLRVPAGPPLGHRRVSYGPHRPLAGIATCRGAPSGLSGACCEDQCALFEHKVSGGLWQPRRPQTPSGCSFPQPALTGSREGIIGATRRRGHDLTSSQVSAG